MVAEAVTEVGAVGGPAAGGGDKPPAEKPADKPAEKEKSAEKPAPAKDKD